MTQEELALVQGIVGAGGVPFITVIVQALKPVFRDDHRWYPLLSLLVGIAVNVAALVLLRGYSVSAVLLGLIQGVTVGLSSAGLYSVGSALRSPQNGVLTAIAPGSKVQKVEYLQTAEGEAIARIVRVGSGSGAGVTVMLKREEIDSLLLTLRQVAETGRNETLKFFYSLALVSTDGRALVYDLANPLDELALSATDLQTFKAGFALVPRPPTG